MKNSRINTRSLTSLLLLWMFLVLLVSGVVLYIAPPGRIAHWSHWRILGLTKEGWQALHTVSALAFVIGGLFHLLRFNWGAVTSYLSRSRRGHAAFFWSSLGSTLIALAVIAGTLAGIPPFSSVTHLGDRAKQSWAEPGLEPPVPHLEEQTLGAIAGRLKVAPEDAVKTLASAGIEDPKLDVSLREIAKKNGTAPSALYHLLSVATGADEQATGGHDLGGGGWGRLTVEQAARRIGVDTETALHNLKAHGLDTTSGTSLRELAQSSGLTPSQIAEKMVLGPDSGPQD